MNRLQIVRSYMTLEMKIENPKKYRKAQRLSHKIIKKQDELIRSYYK